MRPLKICTKSLKICARVFETWQVIYCSTTLHLKIHSILSLTTVSNWNPKFKKLITPLITANSARTSNQPKAEDLIQALLGICVWNYWIKHVTRQGTLVARNVTKDSNDQPSRINLSGVFLGVRFSPYNRGIH